MKPKSDIRAEEKAHPSPLAALGFSLLGYPGAGHFMLGKRALGALFMVVFTALTTGMLYEMYVTFSPVLKAYSDPEALQEISVNWGRILFWILTTGAAWLGSGLHAMMVAKEAVR